MKTQLLDLERSVDEEAEKIRAEREETYKARVELLELFSKLLGKRVRKNFNRYNLYQKYKLFENIIRKEITTEEDKKACLLAISAYHIASGLLNLRTRPLEQLNPALVSSTYSVTFVPLESEVCEPEVESKKGGEETELEESLERAIKLVESERKLKEKYQRFQKARLIKPIKQKYDLGVVGKLGSAISIGAEVAFFAFLFGKECMNLYLTQRNITQTQQMCQEIVNLGQIKKLFKGIEGKTFAVGESEDLKPGTYNLLHFIKYDKKDEIKEYLKKTNIEIVQTKPLSYPLTYLRWDDEFGVYRKNIGGDPWHTGVDCNSITDWNVKAAIDMTVTQTSYEKRGGYFVKGKIGQLRANTNDGRKILEVILLNGKKFKIKVDSLRCCIKQGNRNVFYIKPIEYFDGKDLYIVYCHLRKNSMKVKPGDEVERGQIIGRKGKSGRASSEHLHIELRTDGKPFIRIDPMPFFEIKVIGNVDELYAIVDSANKILYKNFSKTPRYEISF